MNLTKTTPANKTAVFLDGFQIRCGVVLCVRAGVWRVRCGREIIDLWEDDIFSSHAEAQKALNLILN